MRTGLLVLAAAAALAVTLPFQGCGDNDNSVGLPCCSVCGDGVCSGDETICNCPGDCASRVEICTANVPDCGDAHCELHADPGESHERCPQDCPLTCRACGAFDVDAHHQRIRGDACPTGTTEAYREGALIVCNNCDHILDCHGNEQCRTVCGPGCENDTGGCCVRRDCVGFS